MLKTLSTLLAVIVFAGVFSVGYAKEGYARDVREKYVRDSAAPLPQEQAFQFSIHLNPKNQLIFQWKIAPNYYLYRDRIVITPASQNQIQLDYFQLPPGKKKQNAAHEIYQIYNNTLVITVPLIAPVNGKLDLDIHYQGCSSKGFCYTQVKKRLTVVLSNPQGPKDLTSNVIKVQRVTPLWLDQNYATSLLTGHHLLWIIVSFLLIGLLLAFTPCVLPMVPILSSIIVGQHERVTTRQAFSLSLTYVLGMALTYALAGMLVAYLGGSVQAALQKPWIIVLFSGLFVLLALSLFGWYDITLPKRLHRFLVVRSHQHKGGTYLGVFLMGGFSTLIVSPCVSAPLVGALAYIAESGDVLLGGIALLALGFGMGIPLILIGSSAGKLLPQAGPWMDRVKQIFGFLMLGLAIWMLERILPGAMILLLWSMLIVLLALFIWRLQHARKIWHQLKQGIGIILLGYGLILFVGALDGNADLLYFIGKYTASEKYSFLVIKNMAQLDQQLAAAKRNQQQVLLDFYADWCASCVVMDHRVFNQPEVQSALAKYVLLRADVTQNNAFDMELLKRFQVVAPPTMIFFDANGNILTKEAIVGEVNAREFLADLNRLSLK